MPCDLSFWHRTLLGWYAAHKRELPWRDTSDPYRIWVSEVVLQQTRVAQGYDYFLRFMKRFPTVGALAEATEDDVLAAWQGLGYYSRARNLHAAARSIAAAGEFPRSYKEVLALKGVGEYTAAAICSFAYGMPLAVVDGNVYRVLSRFFDIGTPIDSTEGRKYFKAMADELLDCGHPADYNQAIMDFGALQCTPQSPNCPGCPFRDSCSAYNRGVVAERPVKQGRVKVSERYFALVYVRSGNHCYLRKRPAGDIWQGLYEPLLLEFDHRPDSQEVECRPEVLDFLLPSRPHAWRMLQRG